MWPATRSPSLPRRKNTVTLLARPVEARPQLGAKRAAMHAKAAIADRIVVVITCANPTGIAMNHSLETGILIRGGPYPATGSRTAGR